jgi:outer membrane protein OmpA-like peptidoglycan-associated protein
MLTRLAVILCAVAACALTPSGQAHADPLRLSVVSQVNAPAKPTLTLIADEPISDLSVALEPEAEDPGTSGEKGLVKIKQKHLAPGQKVELKLGTGRPGVTHWHGIITCTASGKLWKREASLDTDVRKGLQISFESNIDSPHLSIEKHFVEVQLSEPAQRGTIEVYADDGTKVGSGKAEFSGAAPGTWLHLAWQGEGRPAADAVVLRLAIKIYDTNNNWAAIDLYPWKVSVPHEDIRFESGSADIPDAERAKLDESLRKINAVLDRVEQTLMRFAEKGILTGKPPKPMLFVAGHTDTVGGDSDNLSLSRNRARSIAAYFRQHGFRSPVSFVGCGERQPRVKTADSVDEPRNRRADYTLALQPPPVPPGVSWQLVK